MDLVRSELSQRYSNADLRSQGLQIFTTLDPRLQENTQQAVSLTLDDIERDRKLPDSRSASRERRCRQPNWRSARSRGRPAGARRWF
jgi:membrane peptidoglycan carboxypeptidase